MAADDKPPQRPLPARTPRRRVIGNALGVGAATGAYGLSFGAISAAAGLSTLQTSALSALMFTGASQFAFVAIAATGANPFSGAGAAILVGTRNAFYGLRLASLLDAGGVRRCLAAHLVIDESTAMAVGQTNPDDGRLAFWATGLAVFVMWNLATLAGALGAHALADPKAAGLDAAAPAAFLALLAPRMRSRREWMLALAAAAVALALDPFTPAGVGLLVVAGLTIAAARVTRVARVAERGGPGGAGDPGLRPGPAEAP
jgi:predicted branched-subunit amino acid permease